MKTSGTDPSCVFLWHPQWCYAIKQHAAPRAEPHVALKLMMCEQGRTEKRGWLTFYDLSRPMGERRWFVLREGGPSQPLNSKPQALNPQPRTPNPSPKPETRALPPPISPTAPLAGKFSRTKLIGSTSVCRGSRFFDPSRSNSVFWVSVCFENDHGNQKACLVACVLSPTLTVLSHRKSMVSEV